jgi:hypothetical protein
MTAAELYFRNGPVAFIVSLQGWTDPEAARKAADYLAMFIRSLPRQAARQVHAALLHEREHPEDAAPDSYAATIHEIRDREGRAFLDAVSDWLFRPTEGHTIRLCPAGDASGSGD